MDLQLPGGQPLIPRRLMFPQIRWGAVLAGATGGLATYLVLSMFGFAVGITAVEPRAADPLNTITSSTGAWTGVGMLLAAFVGGYVAARLSGMARRGDGVLHGFVAWATFIVLLLWITTTAVGSVLAGTFGLLGESLAALTTAAESAELQQLTSALSALSWWIFAAMLLSLGLGLWGGVSGARSVRERSAGNHYPQKSG